MMRIRYYQTTDKREWDEFVSNHPKAGLYHLAGWKNVIERAYGHKTFYLLAVDKNYHSPKSNGNERGPAEEPIVGVLPLIQLKSVIFGNSLISIPYFDFAGIVANSEEAERALLGEAYKIGQSIGANSIEIRHAQPLEWFDNLRERNLPGNGGASDIYPYGASPAGSKDGPVCSTKFHKVRMTLDLPESSETLMNSFKSKLRSQIRRPQKAGLVARIGGIELLPDFYEVFAENMRDLGSPVHSKKLIRCILEEFADRAAMVCVHKEHFPVACSLMIGFRNTIENPWSSSRRNFSTFSPNMLLYWTMLEHACEHGFTLFDFGRSSHEEGTYRFKEQWGAKPTQLYWYNASLNGGTAVSGGAEKSKFNAAIRVWQRLPVSLSKIIGPPIRKHIGL